MRWSPRRPMSPTAWYCPISYMAKRPACGAIRRGQKAVIRQHAPKAQDFIIRRYRHNGTVNESERAKNLNKSKVRAESLPSLRRGANHPIGVIKRERPWPVRDLRARQSLHGAPASIALLWAR